MVLYACGEGVCVVVVRVRGVQEPPTVKVTGWPPYRTMCRVLGTGYSGSGSLSTSSQWERWGAQEEQEERQERAAAFRSFGDMVVVAGGGVEVAVTILSSLSVSVTGVDTARSGFPSAGSLLERWRRRRTRSRPATKRMTCWALGQRISPVASIGCHASKHLSFT